MDFTYMSLVTSLPVVTLEVIITLIKVRSTKYMKITNPVSTTTVFGLCNVRASGAFSG